MLHCTFVKSSQKGYIIMVHFKNAVLSVSEFRLGHSKRGRGAFCTTIRDFQSIYRFISEMIQDMAITRYTPSFCLCVRLSVHLSRFHR